MNAYEIYVDYLALKRHFTENNYDYFKYNGKTKTNVVAFEKRYDRYYFTRLTKHKNPHDYLLANLIEEDNWIGDMKVAVYDEWLRRTESLTYRFSQELNNLPDDYAYCVRTNNQIPPLVAAYFQQKISIETLVIMIDMIGLWEYYSRINDPLWLAHSYRWRQYVPFIDYDKPIFQHKLLARWNV